MIKKSKTVLKYIARAAIGMLAIIVVYIIAALALSHITVNAESEKSNDVAIYINSNGVHTDIVVPIKNDSKDWSKDILYTHTKSRDSVVQYVAFGWGDKRFYLDTPRWADLKMSTAARAAFYLGTSAMHTRFYKEMHEDEECVKIMISKKDYQALVAYITDSFLYADGNKVQWIANRSYADHDAFYEAKGRYSLFYTCNTWANNALKAANQKAALWTPYDKGIFLHYQ